MSSFPGWLMPAAVFRLQLSRRWGQFRGAGVFDPPRRAAVDISDRAHTIRRGAWPTWKILCAPVLGVDYDSRVAGRSACWSRWISSNANRAGRLLRTGPDRIGNSIGGDAAQGRRAGSSRRSSASPREREEQYSA